MNHPFWINGSKDSEGFFEKAKFSQERKVQQSVLFWLMLDLLVRHKTHWTHWQTITQHQMKMKPSICLFLIKRLKNYEFNFRGVKNLIYSQQHSVFEVLVDSPLINGVVGWSFFISSDSLPVVVIWFIYELWNFSPSKFNTKTWNIIFNVWNVNAESTTDFNLS